MCSFPGLPIAKTAGLLGNWSGGSRSVYWQVDRTWNSTCKLYHFTSHTSFSFYLSPSKWRSSSLKKFLLSWFQKKICVLKNITKNSADYTVLERAVSCYLLSFWTAKISLHINWIPKIMVQFCYLTLHLGTETVSCRLLQQMARMDRDWNAMPAKIFQKILFLVLPDESCWISSSYHDRSILCLNNRTE